jgi:hypothetical protein
MFGGKSKSPFNLLMMSTTTTPAPGTVAAPEEQAASTSDDLTDPKPDTAITNHADAITEKPRAAAHVDSLSVPSIRVSSIDVERESQKVRSLYESGDDLMWEDGAPVSFAERLAPTQEVPSEEEENVVYGFPMTFRLACAGSMLTRRSCNLDHVASQTLLQVLLQLYRQAIISLRLRGH